MPTGVVSVRSYSGEQSSHSHPWEQLIVPLEGTLALAVGVGSAREGRIQRLGGGLVRAGESHVFAGRGKNRFVVVDVETGAFEGDDAARAWLDRAGERIFFDLDPVLVDAARCAAASASTNALREEWARLLVLMIAERSDLSGGASTSRASARLRRCLAFIERNANRAVTVAELARIAELGESQLHALFRRVVGQSPQEYATRLRLEGARRAVVTTQEPLALLALDWGYADQASFTRAFRRHFGVTPAAARRAELRSKRP